MAVAKDPWGPPTLPDPDSASVSADTPKKSRARLQSLDALRGLTILLMLLVNNVALDKWTPAQLVHAPWNGGVHLADLVFPWFLLCMGLAVPFSVEGMISRGMSAWARLGRVLVRTVLLFFFGCLIVSAELGAPTISLDVLQLLALAYFFSSLLYPLKWPVRAGIALVLLVSYGLAIALIPVPGHGQPVFEETRNLVRHVNQNYLAQFRLSGLLSVIPTTALVLIGSILTNLLRGKLSDGKKLLTLVCAGIVLVAGGFGWNESLPFNKPVWTPSYILLAAGLGSLLLAALYWVMDIRKWTWWAYPLLVYGSNALAAYVLPVLIKVLVLQKVKMDFHGDRMTIRDAWFHLFSDSLGRYWGGWAYTISYMLAVWLILWVFYRRKWFLRV